MTTRVKISNAGLWQVREHVRQQIAELDAGFRETHTGYPVDVIAADFPDQFPGVQLSQEQLNSYAAAVSAGEPFEWVIAL